MEQEENLLEQKLKSTPKQKEKIFKLKEEKNFNSSYSNSSGKSKYTSGNVSIYKSSFHSQKATKHSLEHMERESKVTYLLEHDSSVNDNKIYEDIEKFKKEAPQIYKEKIGQKMQATSKANLIKEAVLNVKPDSTLGDIERTFKNLNEEFGGHYILASSIHRDEGVFIDTKYDLRDLEYVSSNLSWKLRDTGIDVTGEVIDFAPNRNIYFNSENSNWYFDKEFKNKADTSKFQKKINYHAHVLYSNFDKQTGKTARLDRTDLRNLQTIVADSLGMRRGQRYSKTKRMNHWQLKRAIDSKRTSNLKTKESLARLKDLKNQVNVIRQELEENKFDRNSYAVLEQLKKDLTKEIKNKELTINELRNRLDEYRVENEKRRTSIDGTILTKTVKVKEGLLKSKEVRIYDNLSVEGYVLKAKQKQNKLVSENEDLKQENKKLNDFVYELRHHFKVFELDKLKESIKSKIPKVDKKINNKNKSLNNGYER
ncbi:hypothetical protein CRV01_06215 [Arcobacter sp. CECT 8983]|uniref:hypothetical protein n=1 Tax=Arcobacter sp. CECT 8983 TaxID=2044508 RepID=UPI00100A8958|nr:hypothetical protein [Arcobacter sp. CECT 8983]RXJ90741.1 hypothetical protein CRV01_06215 [Arcobacter sp. CECT 8983]